VQSQFLFFASRVLALIFEAFVKSKQPHHRAKTAASVVDIWQKPRPVLDSREQEIRGQSGIFYTHLAWLATL
jgi:hypothetical protein